MSQQLRRRCSAFAPSHQEVSRPLGLGGHTDGRTEPVAVTSATATGRNIVVVDIRVPPVTADGTHVAHWIRVHHPEVGVLMLSQQIDAVDPADRVSPRELGQLFEGRVQDIQGMVQLTEREREVLGLMAEGLTNVGIADRLVLTDRTVESHARSIFMKLGLHRDGHAHRRVLAVLSYLASHQAQGPTGARDDRRPS